MISIVSPISRMIRSAFAERSDSEPPREIYEMPPLPKTANNTEKTIHRNPVIQAFCLNTITVLDALMNNARLLEKILYFVRFDRGPIYVSDVFTFHLKGGNALPLLKIDINPETTFPLKFTGDFDLTLLINPSLKREDFKVLREIMIYEIINMLKMIILQESDWGHIITNLMIHSIKLKRLDETRISIANEAYTYDDFGLGANLYNHPRLLDFKIPVGCPFDLEIHPNLPYKDKSLNFALIKLRTRTEPPIDLIDIAIPSMSYEHIQFDWDVHRTLYFVGNEFKFRVADSLNVYIDYRISALTDSRTEKRRARNNRAIVVRNNILKPLLQSGYFTKEMIDSYKTLQHTDYRVNLKNILSDIT